VDLTGVSPAYTLTTVGPGGVGTTTSDSWQHYLGGGCIVAPNKVLALIYDAADNSIASIATANGRVKVIDVSTGTAVEVETIETLPKTKVFAPVPFIEAVWDGSKVFYRLGDKAAYCAGQRRNLDAWKTYARIIDIEKYQY
jgi:hypothetical protein